MMQTESPFSLQHERAYQIWRDAKLADYPQTAEQLLVTIDDPRDLDEDRFQALQRLLRKTNMALYAGGTGADPDKSIPRALGERFGLRRLDANYLADDDGLSSLTVNPQGDHPQYIPYTDRPIRWHTDGYYNSPDRQIRGLMLHCVHPAAEGGDNALMDHEVAYILLRDENPDYVRALMGAQVMSIPPGTAADGGERGVSTGPVFSLSPADGSLHMRYTARKRNIHWQNDPLVREAVAFLEQILASDSPYIFRARLESGMGLISNNVLHDRSGFADRPGHPKRLLYRARYFDRVADTAP